MKKSPILYLLISVLLAVIPLVASAQAPATALGECNSGNAENIGQHIVDYVLCGASWTSPQSTLFGALSLILNGICLFVASYFIVWNGFKYALFTMQKGVPGGDKVQGGIVVLRSAMLITLLVPVVANGFSPVQVMIRQFAETGASWGDDTSLAGADFVAAEGAISNIDIQGTEEVSNQIIASILCAKQFEIYENLKLDSSTQGSVKVIKEQNDDTVYITWMYQAAKSDTNFFGVKRDVENICGQITFTPHEYISDDFKLGNSGNAIVFTGLSENQQPYADSASAQYDALIKHIDEVLIILEPVASDLIASSQATALRTQLNSADQSKIEALYDEEIGRKSELTNNYTTIIKSLVESSFNYRTAILEAGRNAAQTVNTTDSADSPACKPEQVLCKGQESWVTQLERQGFAATALYHVVQLQINQRILAIQKHFAAASMEVPLYEADYDHPITKYMQDSEAHAIMGDRSSSILSQFNNIRGDRSFSTNFSALENSANTPMELEQDWWAGKINKGLNQITAQAHKVIVGWLSNQNQTGDLILTLMGLGSVLIGIAEYLLILLMFAGVIGVFFLAKKIAGSIAKFFTKKRGEGSGGGGDSPNGNKPADEDESSGGITSILWSVWVFCVLFGGICLFGLPFVLILKWILELQSWAVMMFVAFIYAPLWILSHATITDERFMAEHTMSGYGMLLELLFRPMLLVFSFYAVYHILRISNLGFVMASSFLASLASSGTFGIISLLLILALSIIAALQLVFRTFDLISVMTDSILQRVSFGTKPLGDMQNDNSQKMFMAFMASKSSAHGSRIVGGALSSAANKLGLSSDRSEPKNEKSK